MGIETTQGGQAVDEFAEFEKAGTVEVGDNQDGTDDGDDKKRRGPPKTKPEIETNTGADDDGDEGDDDGDEGDDDGDDKPKKSAREHQIERLKREKRELNRQLREATTGTQELRARLEAVEKGLTGGNDGGNSTAGKAPDPSDTAKYPLGHLDDRYIEDKLEWLADQKATKLADSVLQREQENEQQNRVTAAQRELLGKVDELSAKGSELYEDFQEEVVDTGMRGEWKLQQATFEACTEADNGPQILYELSQNPKEAARVAGLSTFQQAKFVMERDAEISAGKKPRTKPKAGDPPSNTSKGANSKTKISPSTDNLNDFEKAWIADAKANS